MTPIERHWLIQDIAATHDTAFFNGADAALRTVRDRLYRAAQLSEGSTRSTLLEAFLLTVGLDPTALYNPQQRSEIIARRVSFWSALPVEPLPDSSTQTLPVEPLPDSSTQTLPSTR